MKPAPAAAAATAIKPAAIAPSPVKGASTEEPFVVPLLDEPLLDEPLLDEPLLSELLFEGTSFVSTVTFASSFELSPLLFSSDGDVEVSSSGLITGTSG